MLLTGVFVISNVALAMPVLAVGNAVLAENITAEESIAVSGTDAAGEGGQVLTLSGQLGDKTDGMGTADGEEIEAADIAEILYAKVSKEEMEEVAERARNAFMETEPPEVEVSDAAEYERLLLFVRREVEAYFSEVMERAEQEYDELMQENVYQKVFLKLCERMMEEIEAVLGMDKADVMSLLPLEERELYLDLEGLTPVELTRVPFSKIFEGINMDGVERIAYAYRDFEEDDYLIASCAGTANLSFGTSGRGAWWTMITDADQLNGRAIRYIVKPRITFTDSLQPESCWLVPTVYAQDTAGNRVKKEISICQYSDYYGEERGLTISNSEGLDYGQHVYLKFDLNSSQYGSSSNRAVIKIYEGNYSVPEEAMAGNEITDQIYGNMDMNQKDVGYLVTLQEKQWITILSFDENNNVTGCLPLYFNVKNGYNGFFNSELNEKNVNNHSEVVADTLVTNGKLDGYNYFETITFKLNEGYVVNETYRFRLYYWPEGSNEGNQPERATAAYAGLYESIAAAENAGAVDIAGALHLNGKGYEADYSNGVYFSLFFGEDGEGQKAYHFLVKTQEAAAQPMLVGIGVEFTGLKDSNGNEVNCYVAKNKDDSYADGSYVTVMSEGDIDFTRLAPIFKTVNGNLYVTGSSEPERSGESYHDFSNGGVQYTIVSDNGKVQKNVWLTVKKAEEAEPMGIPYNLYVNSLSDSEAKTRVEAGVIYSKREIILATDDDTHDILLMNMGTNVIPKLSVDLESDVLEMDEYWTLSGSHDLAAFSGTEEEKQYGELPNMAKVRLKKKDGVTSGTEVKGALTVKADGQTIMVLELIGIAGAPVMITEDIPEAVKYVPYGTVIQNSGKYVRAGVRYELMSGSLPEGMELRESGEIYGIPREEGSFRFWVKMVSSKPSTSQTKDFTLVVKENTDENVDAATDAGYDVTQRIAEVVIGSSESHTFVSQGLLEEFVDVYLDGERLVRDVDYSAESGSTRLTISSQTLTRANEVGTHTLGVEFRTENGNLLRKAAQNFDVVEGNAGDDGDAGNDGSGGNEPGNSGSGNGNAGNGNGGNGGSGNNASGSASGSSEGGSEENGSDSPSGNPSQRTANAIAAKGTATGAVASRTTVYIVEPGDTLSKIAVKYYGNASLWRKIYEDNRDIIINPNRIRTGMRIKLYLADMTEEKTEDGTSDVMGTYTVRSGDSLWKIAKAMYGQGWQWRRIYDANRNVIPDSLILRVGQILVIP